MSKCSKNLIFAEKDLTKMCFSFYLNIHYTYGIYFHLAILFPAPLTWYDAKSEQTMLVGLEIFNSYTCTSPTVYTNVVKYLDWINKVVDTEEEECLEIPIPKKNDIETSKNREKKHPFYVEQMQLTVYDASNHKIAHTGVARIFWLIAHLEAIYTNI